MANSGMVETRKETGLQKPLKNVDQYHDGNDLAYGVY